MHQADAHQPIKTDPSQSLADYKEAQDVTAPPDPVAEGTTSDVPIHGEKTNVLFHPTPSVSYERWYTLHWNIRRHYRRRKDVWWRSQRLDSLGHVSIVWCLAVGEGAHTKR
jgi:hypothetical protein